jgi:hypothetical protein
MLNALIGGVGKILRPRAWSATWPSGLFDYPLPANGTVFGTPGWITDAGVAWSSSSSTLAGTGTRTWGTGTGYRGRGVIIHAAGAAGSARSQLNGANIFPHSEQAGEIDSSFSDELAYKRFVCILAFEAAGLFANGFGVHFSAFNAGNPDIMTGAMGFGFQKSAAGVISLISRQALGVGAVITHAQYAPAGGDTDLGKFNVYEAIAVPARPGSDPFIKFKVNGNLIASKKVGSAADAGCPASPLHSTGNYGLIPTFMALNNTNQLAVAGVRYSMGPTEQSVLAQ